VSTRYLLPCPCGKKIPVETTHAGETVSCVCGQQIEVPTLLALRSLEPAEEEPDAVAARSWGVSQGLAIVGVMVMLGAAAALIYFYVHQPVPPRAVYNETIVERDIQNLTLLGSERLWERLRRGLGGSGRIDPAYREALGTYWISRYATVSEAYEGAVKQYHIRLGVGLAVFVLGMATAIFGFVQARAKSI